MHKSRLACLVIDSRTEDLDAEAGFWGEALGCPVQSSDDPANARYRRLETGPSQPGILVQQVEHESRVHLDIESDDIDAEVTRLEKLGARRVARVKRWWVLEAPGGQRFCVVAPQRDDFDEKANVWDDA